jgi:ethanolamine permease
MYVLAMAALFQLRTSEPGLLRPFRAPLFPWLPGLALALAVLCLISVAWTAPRLALVFAVLLGLGTLLSVRDHKASV